MAGCSHQSAVRALHEAGVAPAVIACRLRLSTKQIARVIAAKQPGGHK